MVQPLGGAYSQPGFAGAAGAGEGHEANCVAFHENTCRVQFFLAPYKWRGLDGQIVGNRAWRIQSRVGHKHLSLENAKDPCRTVLVLWLMLYYIGTMRIVYNDVAY
jgi:hypothetical protein